MRESGIESAMVLGLCLLLGLLGLGFLLGESAVRVKEYERTVVVKGLSEREYPADVVIWPIRFSEAGDELTALYEKLDESAGKIRTFLTSNGIDAADITVSPPDVTDKWAEQYSSGRRPEFRYIAMQTVTVYSQDVKGVRKVMSRLSELGKRGIAFTGGRYGDQVEYLFTRLNEIKPAMIEEATRKAREVAEKFAADSNSRLGKIKRARQGQFSITPRDRNNPHIKRVRVVSTVEYYLSD
ncbi:MAG TPA: SIMPL domain-containing protein [Chromatiales bacterium]|nr:SIMPL domain-containing protein [Chromatiales bacterium]